MSILIDVVIVAIVVRAWMSAHCAFWLAPLMMMLAADGD
jgi:hypothetical protein